MRNEKSVRPLPDHGPKRRVDLPFAACTQENNLLAVGIGGGPYIPNIGLGSGTVRVHQHSDAWDGGREFAQQRKSLHFKLGGKETHAGHVATRPIEARYQTEPDRVIT